MGMRFIVPDGITQLENQIEALKWQLEHDTNDKDIKYHVEALKALERKLESLKQITRSGKE